MLCVDKCIHAEKVDLHSAILKGPRDSSVTCSCLQLVACKYSADLSKWGK